MLTLTSTAAGTSGVIAAVIVALIAVGLVVLWVAAVVSILRSDLTAPIVKALWVIAAFAFPLAGPIVWFIASGYQRRHTAIQA
jgi:hypothetical protein